MATLLDTLTAVTADAPLQDTPDFIGFLRSEAVTQSSDPFTRLVTAALRAGSHANATIAGHQAAVRRLFPSTPSDAVTAFCVSEARGPHPRYIETKLEGSEGNYHISGEKMWGTMAPAASLLYVAASTGVTDGQNQLAMVAVATGQDSIEQIPLPPERQAGAIPICDLKFEQTKVERVFEGDAYNGHIKPFRLLEDVFSTIATQISLFRLGGATGLDHAQREDLLGLIVQGQAIAQSEMASSGDLLLITSYLRASQAHWAQLEAGWRNASSELRPHWSPERKILTVAARARAQRRANAWQELGESLPQESA